MRPRTFLPVLAALLLADAGAHALPCKGRSGIAGACFVVHGRMSLANGNPAVRIWPVGTRRILGVEGDEEPVMPARLRELLDGDTRVYADFEVCPLEPERPGHMRTVCVESAVKVVVERQGAPGEEPEVRVLAGEIRDPAP